MTFSESTDAINHDAAAWVARADRGLTENEMAELDAWLAGDTRRAGAYMRMSAVSAAADIQMAAGAPLNSHSSTNPVLTRRLWVAGAVAAAASVAGFGVYRELTRSRVFTTQKGESRAFTLEDGSVVTLNTATRLEIRYSRTLRQIVLISGEALFDVAKDVKRPFVVKAPHVDVRAVGTSFTVASATDQTVRVLVREGVVDLARPARTDATPVRLTANNRAVIRDEATPAVVSPISPVELSHELAWREGQLVFTGTRLSTAIAEFARYNDTQIVVTDSSLASKEVAGVFNARDPVGFAHAAATSLGAQVEAHDDYVLITR